MSAGGIAREEVQALQQFCSLDRQLRAHAADSREEVRTLVRRRNECMAALLRTMQQRNIECLAVNDLVDKCKYARILLSHTTRQITPTLVKEALTNHFAELEEAWSGNMTVEEAVPLLYSAVRQDRTRTKPLVTFSNCLPRGLKPEHVVPASTDTHVSKMVTKLHTLQAQYSETVSTVRAKRGELQEQKAEHLPLVEAFLTKRDTNMQMIVSKSGERLCLRRRPAHLRPPMSVAQFRAVLTTALTKLQARGIAPENVVQHRDALIDAVLECMDDNRSILTKESIQILYMKPKDTPAV